MVFVKVRSKLCGPRFLALLPDPGLISVNSMIMFCILTVTVPDKRSWILEVVIVRRRNNLGTGNLEWGGNREGLRKGRSVYE